MDRTMELNTISGVCRSSIFKSIKAWRWHLLIKEDSLSLVDSWRCKLLRGQADCQRIRYGFFVNGSFGRGQWSTAESSLNCRRLWHVSAGEKWSRDEGESVAIEWRGRSVGNLDLDYANGHPGVEEERENLRWCHKSPYRSPPPPLHTRTFIL